MKIGKSDSRIKLTVTLYYSRLTRIGEKRRELVHMRDFWNLLKWKHHLNLLKEQVKDAKMPERLREMVYGRIPK